MFLCYATKKAFYRPVSGDVQDKSERTKGGNISTIRILITVYIGGRVAQLRRGRTDQDKDNEVGMNEEGANYN